jgi:hypothetical protein
MILSDKSATFRDHALGKHGSRVIDVTRVQHPPTFSEYLERNIQSLVAWGACRIDPKNADNLKPSVWRWRSAQPTSTYARPLSTWRRNGLTLRASNPALRDAVSDFNPRQLLDVNRAA